MKSNAVRAFSWSSPPWRSGFPADRRVTGAEEPRRSEPWTARTAGKEWGREGRSQEWSKNSIRSPQKLA